MDFSQALEHLQYDRLKLSRSGWNGSGMYAVYQPGYPDGVPINKNTSNATGIPEGTICVFRPYFMLKCVDDTFVPWTPSVSDILAQDWFIVD